MPRPASLILFLISLLSQPLTSHAQPASPPASTDPHQVELQAANAEAMRAAKPGPADIPVFDQAVLHLPQGMAFIPAPEAARLMRASGNQADDNLAGIVFSQGDAEWLATIEWRKVGYVRDDDSANLNADDIRTDLREGTEAGNPDRLAHRFPEVEVGDWVQKPTYDKSTHQLAWAIPVFQKVSRAATLNYNVRMLGRDGHLNVDVLDDPAAIEGDRKDIAILLASIEYLPGKRYADFNESTDHVAEFGLAALIGIVAAKKLGLIALAGVFVLKFAKVGLIAAAGIGLVVRRFFRRTPRT